MTLMHLRLRQCPIPHPDRHSHPALTDQSSATTKLWIPCSKVINAPSHFWSHRQSKILKTHNSKNSTVSKMINRLIMQAEKKIKTYLISSKRVLRRLRMSRHVPLFVFALRLSHMLIIIWILLFGYAGLRVLRWRLVAFPYWDRPTLYYQSSCDSVLPSLLLSFLLLHFM